MKQKTVLMDEVAVDRAIARIAHEIIERNKGVDDIALVGIVTRGAPMAKLISDKIKRFEGVDVPYGSVDISLYRDDIEEISPMPVLNGTNIDFAVAGKKIVLCDDVLFTGRTARAAMEAVLAKGRPRNVQLAVLVDRGHPRRLRRQKHTYHPVGNGCGALPRNGRSARRQAVRPKRLMPSKNTYVSAF